MFNNKIAVSNHGDVIGHPFLIVCGFLLALCDLDMSAYLVLSRKGAVLLFRNLILFMNNCCDHIQFGVTKFRIALD